MNANEIWLLPLLPWSTEVLSQGKREDYKGSLQLLPMTSRLSSPLQSLLVEQAPTTTKLKDTLAGF